MNSKIKNTLLNKLISVFKKLISFLNKLTFVLKKTNFFKNKVNKQKNSFKEDLDFFALSKYQLQNLLDKNIHFGFFQLEDFSDKEEKNILLKKSIRKNQEELLSFLKGTDFKQPLVLICKTGLISQNLSQELREQGFVNVYFIQGGVQALLEEKSYS